MMNVKIVVVLCFFVLHLIFSGCGESDNSETNKPITLNMAKIFGHNHNLLNLDTIGYNIKTLQLQRTLKNKRILVSDIKSFNVFEKDSIIYLVGLIDGYRNPFKYIYARIESKVFAEIISSKDFSLTVGLLVSDVKPSFNSNFNRVTQQIDGEEGGYYEEYEEELITRTTVEGKIIAVLP